MPSFLLNSGMLAWKVIYNKTPTIVDGTNGQSGRSHLKFVVLALQRRQ